MTSEYMRLFKRIYTLVKRAMIDRLIDRGSLHISCFLPLCLPEHGLDEVRAFDHALRETLLGLDLASRYAEIVEMNCSAGSLGAGQ